MAKKSEERKNLGVGLDVGTAFLVSARTRGDGAEAEVEYNLLRDAFIKLEKDDDTANLLDTAGASYTSDDKFIYVVGDSAIQVANTISAEVRRPMRYGIISSVDDDAVQMMEALIAKVLGEPAYIGEACCFTVPSEPLNPGKDQAYLNNEYHQDKLNQILRDRGYTPYPINEAMCIALDQLRNHGLTGICTSFGAGQVNIASVAMGVPGKTFSILGSGDYIDQKIAHQFGLTVPKATRLKERGISESGSYRPIHVLNDRNSSDKKIEAICLAYTRLVSNVVENMNRQFSSLSFEEPIPIVLAGGTSLIGGFKELFEQVLKDKKPPFEVSEVIHAEDALRSVARGAMYRAMVQERKKAAGE